MSQDQLDRARSAAVAEATLPAIRRLAKQYEVSTARITLAWELAAAPNVIPVVGASSRATRADSAASASLTLTSREVADIDHEAAHVVVPAVF